MKDNEKRTNDMQQETTAPREAGPILCRFMRETDVPACAAIEACAAGAKPHCAKSWRRKTRACLLPKPKEKSPGLRCSSSCAARQASTP